MESMLFKEKKFKIFLNNEFVGFILAKNIGHAFEKIKEHVKNGTIKTNGTTVLEIRP